MKKIQDKYNPLIGFAFRRWKSMGWEEILSEAALLVHLAVKIEDVKKLVSKKEEPHEPMEIVKRQAQGDRD